jgi:tetratricopeptide (TPR) repeat protein
LAEKFDLADQRYFMLANMANTYDDRAHTEGRSVEQALADLDSAAALYTQLLAMVRTTDDPHREALLLFNVASFYYQSRQEPARADGLFTQSIAVSERSGDEDTRVLAVYDRAFARVQLLRLEDARRDFADALKSYQDRRVAGNPNVAWAEHHIEVLDTLIDLKNRMPTREWKQIVEEHRDEFRETAREVKKLGVAEPSGFGNKADGK